MSKPPILTVVQFKEGEESDYLITSPKEIQLTLNAIAQKNSAAVIYFNNDENFIKTVLLTANENGVWLDVGPDDEINKIALHSNNITFVTMHRDAKVQFVCHHFQMAVYAGHPAFYCALPDSMVRLQRRNYFRLPVSPEAPLTCIIPHQHGETIRLDKVNINDISVGGLSLALKESNARLEAGGLYPNCQINLPDTGTLNVTLLIKNLFESTTASGAMTKHAGCEFYKLDSASSILLQRYVGVMQSQLPGLR